MRLRGAAVCSFSAQPPSETLLAALVFLCRVLFVPLIGLVQASDGAVDTDAMMIEQLTELIKENFDAKKVMKKMRKMEI